MQVFYLIEPKREEREPEPQKLLHSGMLREKTQLRSLLVYLGFEALDKPTQRLCPASTRQPVGCWRRLTDRPLPVRGYAALWDMTPVLSCWLAAALGAGQVRRHIPPRAA